jgi:integrase/recombinase XerD
MQIDKIKKFESYLKDKNLSVNSVQSYVRDITIILSNEKTVNKNKMIDIMLYKIDKIKQNRQIKVSTINRKVASINKFFEFENVKKRVKVIKQVPNSILQDIISTNDIERLLRFSNPNTKALIACLALTGTRISELLQIRKIDIIEKNETIEIMGKGSKIRIIFICKQLQKILLNYININKKNKSNFVFSSSRQYCHKILKLVAGKSKVKKSRVHCHAFRHFFATRLLNEGLPFPILQDILGHSPDPSSSITYRYIHITVKEVLKKINNIIKIQDYKQ